MTNITLSIEDSIYQKMRQYSEIKWSEFIRKILKERIEQLEKLDQNKQETLLAMLISEEVLKRDWDNEADERWNNV